MTEDDRVVLKVVSILLEYPDDEGHRHRMDEVAALVGELDDEVNAAWKAWASVPRWDLMKLYVSAFDFDAQCSLNITAHELGDSRNRGAALLEIAELYRQAGFETPDHQLPDFLPMLLELVAVRPNIVPEAVLNRMATVSRRIADRLGKSHPYARLLDLIPSRVGHAAVTAGPAAAENPDLKDLPYPIEYP